MDDQKPAPSLFTAKIEQFKAQLSETAMHALQLGVLIGGAALLALLVVTCWVNDRPKLGRLDTGAGAASAVPGSQEDRAIINGVREALPFGKNTQGENCFPLGSPGELTVINGNIVGPNGSFGRPAATSATNPGTSGYQTYPTNPTQTTYSAPAHTGAYNLPARSSYHIPITDGDGTRLKTITNK